MPREVVEDLAYYRSADLGVLAPRGWRCFGLYGSNGSTLMVTPDAPGRDPFDARLTGSAVQLSLSIGDTSGRFEAAQIAARLFPDRMKFAESVVAEGLEPKSAFPSGPFPTDVIRRRTRNVVEFETPAHRDGMGTKSRLVAGGDPISGVAIMDDDNDATLLTVRLPPKLRHLSQVVISAAE